MRTRSVVRTLITARLCTRALALVDVALDASLITHYTLTMCQYARDTYEYSACPMGQGGVYLLGTPTPAPSDLYLSNVGHLPVSSRGHWYGTSTPGLPGAGGAPCSH
jgi:hypothetical protein